MNNSKGKIEPMHTVLLNSVDFAVLPGCFACWVPAGRRASGDKLSVSATTGTDRNPEREKTKNWENHLNSHFVSCFEAEYWTVLLTVYYPLSEVAEEAEVLAAVFHILGNVFVQ